jgi:hypothetical protein
VRLSVSGKHLGSLSDCGRSRDGLRGEPRPLPRPGDLPGSPGRKGRQWGARVPSSGPLHRCVHAGSWGLGRCEWRLDWRLPGASVSGSCCSPPREATLGGTAVRETNLRAKVHALDRCARALYWLQKSARGVGSREAISVAAGVGDGGLAPGFGKPPRGETASRNRASGDGCSAKRSAEDHLLVEGVSGRGSPQPSRAAGGTGLGLAAYRVNSMRARRQEASELRLPWVGGGQEPLPGRGKAERSGLGGVKLPGSPA